MRRRAEEKSEVGRVAQLARRFSQQKNQFVDAVSEFRKAVQAKPDFVRAWNNLGSALARPAMWWSL